MNSSLLLATLNLSLGALVFLLSFVILRENPRQKLNLVVSLMLFFGGVGSILGALGLLAARTVTEETVGSSEVFQNLAYVWEFFFPSLLLFASVFPEERRFVRRFPAFPVLVYIPHIFHFMLLVTLAWFLPLDVLPAHSGLWGILAKFFLGIHQALFSLVNLTYGVAAALLLFSSYRHTTDPRVKQQLRVIGMGLTVCLFFYSAATSLPTLLSFPILDWQANGLTTIALLAGSGAIAYSIVRHKFLDTKLLARRAILYAVASALLVGFYLVVVVQLNRFFSRVTGINVEVFEPVFLIMALILFQPAVSKLEDMLEHYFLRDPGDYRNVLTRLGRELLTTIDLDLLLARSIRTIADALTLRNAYIVALAREAPLIHIGRGEPAPEEDVARLAEVLNRLPGDHETFRLTEADSPVRARDREFLQRVFGTEIVVALRTKGETVGGLLLGPKVTGTVFTSEDLALLSQLASQMSVSLQNGLLLRDRVAVARFEEELNLARQIQRSFLPSEFPVVDHLDLYAMTIPSKEVGGDLYDLVTVHDDCFFFAIGDVSGKGVPAALLSSMLQASLRTQAGASTPSGVAQILRNINSLVVKSTTPEQFATFFLAYLDPRSMQLKFCNAGHNFPVLLKRDGKQLELERGGMLLGIIEGTGFEEGTVPLAAGDRLILYTDGVSEAENEDEEMFGEERLIQLVESLPRELSAREVTERILEELYGFLGDNEAQDDVTLMVLLVREPQPSILRPEREAVASEALPPA